MTLLPIHIIAGAIGLVSGAVALSVVKGRRLHRRSGMIFVAAMLVMSASGVGIAMVKPNRGSVLGGGLAFYLVTTALLTTRRLGLGLNLAAALLGLAVGIVGFTFGLQAVHSASGKLNGYPPPLYFIFGAIALLAVDGDIRMMLALRLQGRRRIARHLWRMCFAMFIATGSFFLGQAKVFPKSIRIMPLLAIPAVLPLLLMLVWLTRALFAKRSRVAPELYRSDATSSAG